jgi:hypothetical protein
MLNIVSLICFCSDRSYAIHHHEIDTSMNFFELISISQFCADCSGIFEYVFLGHDKVPSISGIKCEDLID